MLAARYAPLRTARHGPPAAPSWNARHALVVGAGLAGAAVSERLAARGWRIELIERLATPATEASGIPAGVFHPHVSRDDSVLSRLTRAGFLYSLARWRALETTGQRLSWEACGVLQMAKDAHEEARMAATVRACGFPPEYVDYLPRASAEGKTGRAVRTGGWWFPDSGWMQPAALVRAQLAAADSGSRMVFHYGAEVHALSGDGLLWRALAADGTEIASAPVVVLANSHDAARLVPLGVLLKRVRGQLTCLPAGDAQAPTAVIAGAGHLIPDTDGGTIVGATYDFETENPELRAEDHVGNLERLERLLPGAAAAFDPAALKGAVGFRCVAADRLPLIGALPDAGADRPGTPARDCPRLPGLFGAFAYASRGLTWAALGGEIIASVLEGEPLPIEADLADAIDPARFLLRAARRRPVNRHD